MVCPLGTRRRYFGFHLAASGGGDRRGEVEADLDGYLFKKRLARQGSGKRGGYRTLIGYQRPNAERIIFLYAFAKNAKANISAKE